MTVQENRTHEMVQQAARELATYYRRKNEEADSGPDTPPEQVALELGLQLRGHETKPIIRSFVKGYFALPGDGVPRWVIDQVIKELESDKT